MKVAPPIGEPVTLRESRLRTVLLTAVSAVFAVAGGAIVVGGDRSLAAWACLVLSGVATAFFAWGLAGARTLTIDANGFNATIGLPWRRPIRVAWRDVTGFSQVHMPGQTIVGFTLRPGAAPVTSRLRRLVEDATMPDAPDGTLPSLYGGMNAAALIAYLERWRGYAASRHEPG